MSKTIGPVEAKNINRKLSSRIFFSIREFFVADGVYKNVEDKDCYVGGCQVTRVGIDQRENLYVYYYKDNKPYIIKPGDHSTEDMINILEAIS